MARPRVGFLGVGWIGRHRMEAMLGCGAIEAIAIVDPDSNMAQAAQALAPDAAILPSLDEMLALSPDGVVIATPSALHAAQAISALQAGAAVFCQKPLGRSAAEAEAVVAAARKADRLLAVDLSYRFTDAMRAIVPLIRGGKLGRIHAVDLVFHNGYGPDKPWFYDKSQAGGGCVMDLAVHLVDLAMWALDFPELEGDVAAILLHQGRPVAHHEVEDYAIAQFRLTNGTAVRLACSWRLNGGCDAEIGAAFYGNKGGAALRNQNGSFYDFTAEHYRGTAREQIARPPDPWGSRAGLHWADKLAQGGRFDTNAGELIMVARLLDRIYAAAQPRDERDERPARRSADLY